MATCRNLCHLLIIILLISLVGCNSNTNISNSSSSTQSTIPTSTITNVKETSTSTDLNENSSTLRSIPEEESTTKISAIDKNEFDYNDYIGKWYSSESAKSYDETFDLGGSILEIEVISKNYIKGKSASISAPPANRIADIEFEGKLINNSIKFNFEDGFMNKGNATLTLEKGKVMVNVNDIEMPDENEVGWSYNGGEFIKSK